MVRARFVALLFPVAAWTCVSTQLPLPVSPLGSAQMTCFLPRWCLRRVALRRAGILTVLLSAALVSNALQFIWLFICAGLPPTFWFLGLPFSLLVLPDSLGSFPTALPSYRMGLQELRDHLDSLTILDPFWTSHFGRAPPPVSPRRIIRTHAPHPSSAPRVQPVVTRTVLVGTTKEVGVRRTPTPRPCRWREIGLEDKGAVRQIHRVCCLQVERPPM